MSEVIFNKQGVPLIAYGSKSLITTTGAPKSKGKIDTKRTITVKGKHATIKKTGDERPDVSEQLEIIEDKESAGTHEVAAWSSTNNFPQRANTIISSVGVLNTGLKFIRNFTLGQGIFPCQVTGYDEYGNEKLQVIDNAELVTFCQSRMVRRYLEKALRDYLKYGTAAVQMLLNDDKTKMVGLHTLNALHTRFTVAKKGIIEKAIISGKWPVAPGAGEFEALDLLDEYDPAFHLDTLKNENKVKSTSYVFAIRDSWSNSEYYSEPVWWSAHQAGWTEVAALVPRFLKKAFENQITWKWHVKIPYAFWDKKFPQADYKKPSERQAAIEAYIDDIETNLVGTDNADKPIFTFYEINPTNGKAEEQWIIEALDNKYKENDKLITSAAANSEILFSLMLNPNVLGAGMPGGTYAGNQGGSNIREAFLVNIANAWIDRQNILDPLETFLHFNGVKDIQLRFRSTILTTLDTGAGTTQKLS